MTHKRQAEATLKGFQYQFDKTILEILSADNGETVLVEGLEDLDVEGHTILESIQCKYHELSNYSKRLIQDPVLKMLKGFKESTSSSKQLKYRLFIHLKNKPQRYDLENLSLNDWKEILDLSSPDKQEQTFLMSYLTVELGSSIEEQKSKVLNKIQETFLLSNQDEKALLYAALQTFILETAQKKKDQDRKIIKQSLIEKFSNTIQRVFYAGYSRWLGEEKYIQFLKKTIKSQCLLGKTKNRLIFLDLDSMNVSENQIVHFINDLLSKHFAIGKTLYDAKPFIVVIKTKNPDQLKVLKQKLLLKGTWFNDGYEEIKFNFQYFSTEPLIQRKEARHGPIPSPQIQNTSFFLKLISSNSLDESIEEIKKTIDSVFLVGKHSSHKDYFSHDFGGYVLPIQTDSIDLLTKLLCT